MDILTTMIWEVSMYPSDLKDSEWDRIKHFFDRPAMAYAAE